jgi:signal transduction histidine kinase
MTAVPVADLVSDALSGADALAKARGVRLAGTASGPIVVRADSRELSRVLTNLVLNAIRHTPADGTVAVHAGNADGAAVLAVTDGCGGIPDADLARVFDVGWRRTEARTPGPQSGAGLGLAIARGIVEAHAGSITVANTGPGCCFEVRLPSAR